MEKITQMQYEYALERIEDLLPVVDGYAAPSAFRPPPCSAACGEGHLLLKFNIFGIDSKNI